ncbi:hypothetical protein PT7_2950 [Pusillimonas sp. T7-7]|nr:hypothetical protein PT7_2950 [Pusillimonas sp. T7-7]
MRILITCSSFPGTTKTVSFVFPPSNAGLKVFDVITNYIKGTTSPSGP